MTDTQTDAPGKADGPSGAGVAGRARRLIHGWSANLVQMVLGLTQQLLLIPAFLHVWSGDMLAAWLAIYAAGSLVIVADAGLQLRAINRFLAFKSCADCDGRTASFYRAMLRIYLAIVAGARRAAVRGRCISRRPSAVLGFHATADIRRRDAGDDAGHAPELARQPRLRPLSRARPIWPGRLAAKRRTAARPDRAACRARHVRKPARGGDRLRLDAAPVHDLHRCLRCAAPVSVPAPCRKAAVRRAILALEHRTVRPRAALRGRQHHRACARQRSGPAGLARSSPIASRWRNGG